MDSGWLCDCIWRVGQGESVEGIYMYNILGKGRAKEIQDSATRCRWHRCGLGESYTNVTSYSLYNHALQI